MPDGNGEVVALEVLLCSLSFFGYLGMSIVDPLFRFPKEPGQTG